MCTISCQIGVCLSGPLWKLATPVKAWCPGAYPTPWDSHTPMISNMLLAVLATHRISRDLFLIFHVLSWIIIWAILCRNWRMSWNSRAPMFELCQNLLKYSYVYNFWVVERIKQEKQKIHLLLICESVPNMRNIADKYLL